MPSSQVLVRLPQTTLKRRQLKDKITKHFQKSQVSKDFDVEDVNIILENDSKIWLTVTFNEPAGVEFVLSREKHHELIIDGVVIPFEVKRHLPIPSWRLVSPSVDSDSDPETFVVLDENKHKSEAKGSEISAEGGTLLAGQQENLPSCRSDSAECNKDQQPSSEHDQEEEVDPIYSLREKEPDWWQAKAAEEEAQKKHEAEAEVEEDEQLIEVTGYKKTQGIGVLKLYFENPLRSGGGEIETIGRDPKTGAVRITFKNPLVAAVVEARRHKLDRSNLKVKLITKKKRRPLPINARCLFLEGIPDGCSSESVKLFIENRASMGGEPKIQYGKKPGTALCTFSRDIPDLDAVVTNVSKKKLQEVVITAKKVQEADAVLVTGFSKDVNLVTIELYFDNKNKSGGGRVRDVQPGPMDGQAIVYFEDWKVVNEVLHKDTHKIGRKAVKVETYHECLWKLSHGDQASVSDIPDKTSPEQVKRSTGNVASSIKGAEAQETGQKVGMKKPQVGQRVQVQIQGEQGGKVADAQEMPESDHQEDVEQLIEVTGFKPSTGDEVLGLYFENRGKSGGGEIEMLERDPKTGAVRITFKNQSVAVEVEKRKHKLACANLNVKLITKKKRRPLPVNARCMFLEGIPDGCSSEHLKLFIENRASMDEEPTIQYGEKPGTAICTFSRDIPGLDDIVTKVSKKTMKDVVITARKVHEADAVLVTEFSKDVSLETIELYFDNKKSGGGGVREVQPGPMDGQVIVYFEDWKVVQDVLARGLHKLGGNDLLTDSYHEFLGRLSPLDAPTPHTPKPVSVKVQEPIMEFLCGKGENTKKKLLKDLAKAKAKLLWPDGSQKSQAKLEPIIDESQQPWLNWEKEAVDVLTRFMGGCKLARVPVPQKLWKGAADKLQKMTTACSMGLDTQLHEVILVGEQRDVDGTEVKINLVTKELQKNADYDAAQATEDINWDAKKLQLFTLCGIKQEIEKSFPALKITIFSSPGKTGITLDGVRSTVKEVELKIRRMMDSLEKTEFKSGSIKVRFVQHVPDKIHEVLGSRNIRAACSGSDDGKITIHGATSRDIREAKAYIDNEIDEDVITIKGSALAAVQGHEGKKLVDFINKQKLVMVEIKQDIIELAGFKSKLEEAKSQIIEFLKNTIVIKEHISCHAADIKDINRFWHDEVEVAEMANQTNYVKIELKRQGSESGFAIEGNQEGIGKAREICLGLIARLDRNPRVPPVSDKARTRFEDYTVLQSPDQSEDGVSDTDDVPMRVPMQQQYSQQDTGHKKLRRKKLARSADSEQLLQTSPRNETDSKIGPSQSSQRGNMFQRFMRPKTVPRSDEKFITNGLTIVVRRGDITKQQVDAIVSPSNPKLQHGGGAAKAIEMAAGPQLGSFCAGVLTNRPNQPLQASECIVSPGFNLNCRHIIHSVGPGQNMSPQQFNSILNQAFVNCLLKADESQAQSLAMPLIGSGAVGAPKEDCAELLIRALVNFSSTPIMFLNEVYLVNIDTEATEALVQCCKDII
ncbi:protein mono-ADP-ribosyltransferase PARP14-like isoform X3 [Asterias rubens]|uniref:protein mono-ADP-ribosyltransferase PARP14-like isoform X3 n=1 Tax=Asterias rubens TaxID=7604 RepID=UPI001455326E|nr:protein mono-ADP-ribosyltransferase PARP14-like isoform X3 [Asterias rubens]